MREHDINIFIENFMRQTFDDADIYLEVHYDICSMQYKGKLLIKYGDFDEGFDILIDDFYAEKQLVVFCNYVVTMTKQRYEEYLRKEK